MFEDPEPRRYPKPLPANEAEQLMFAKRYFDLYLDEDAPKYVINSFKGAVLVSYLFGADACRDYLVHRGTAYPKSYVALLRSEQDDW